MLDFTTGEDMIFVFYPMNRANVTIRGKLLDRPLRSPEVWGSKIWRKSPHECCKIVSPRHRPPL